MYALLYKIYLLIIHVYIYTYVHQIDTHTHAIYIYIYVCVCVCVWLSSKFTTKSKSIKNNGLSTKIQSNIMSILGNLKFYNVKTQTCEFLSCFIWLLKYYIYECVCVYEKEDNIENLIDMFHSKYNFIKNACL